MSRPPKVVIPGLNRGAGIPPGYILGRRRGTGKGPAELLDLSQMKGAGLATTAQVTQVVDQLSTALSTTTAGLAGAALMMGGEGEDGASGPPGQPGTAGTAGSPGVTGPQGPIGFGMDGLDGEAAMPMPGAPVVTTSTTASYTHALPSGQGVNSIYRTDTIKSSWPYTSTVSGVAGTTLTLSSAVAQAAFEPAYMKGVVFMRIWNTTQNKSAWVSDAPTTSTFTVTSASDISTWVATDAIRMGEPSFSAVALDISLMLQAQLGRVFRQSSIAISATVIPNAGSTDARFGIWSQPVSGAQSPLAGEAAVQLSGVLISACKDLSPISNTNLVYLNDTTITSTSIVLANVLSVQEDVSVVSSVTGGGGMAGAPGAAGGTGPQGPMGFALDGQDGEEGMPIPGAAGAAGAAGAGGGALTLLGSATSTGASGALTVSGIPGTAKDLIVIIYGATTDTASQLTTISMNGSPNGDMQRHYAQGGVASADQLLNAAALNLFAAYPGSSYTAGMAGSQEMTFFEYANTSFWKTFHFTARQPNNVSSGNAYTMAGNGQFRTTSAITSITSTLAAGNWVTGSVMRVYGRT